MSKRKKNANGIPPDLQVWVEARRAAKAAGSARAQPADQSALSSSTAAPSSSASTPESNVTSRTP